VLDVAPLWPAGHLPHRWGDRPAARFSLVSNVAERGVALKLPISPLEGEMAGRPDGGAKDCGLREIHRSLP
jgi:assimilatory nitrate reductase catalytic subunit